MFTILNDCLEFHLWSSRRSREVLDTASPYISFRIICRSTRGCVLYILFDKVVKDEFKQDLQSAIINEDEEKVDGRAGRGAKAQYTSNSPAVDGNIQEEPKSRLERKETVTVDVWLKGIASFLCLDAGNLLKLWMPAFY